MKWSKLKSEIENRFCESLKKRVSINSTAYGACSCGHAWITLDKVIIANFCTRAYYNNESGQVTDNGKYDNLKNTYGELSRQDIYESCWSYVHELSIEEALESEDPLIQTLSVIDKRVGKRRLVQLNAEEMHPLASHLFKERLTAENITIPN
jgi:hypothetical protein